MRPELPAAATASDAAGAEAFMRYFWDVVNYAYATGDTAAVIDISEEGCMGCRGLKDGVETATSVGARWVDFEWMTADYLAQPYEDTELYLVSALMVLKPEAHVIDATGTRGEINGPWVKSFRVLLEWHEGGWRTYAIEYPDPDQ